MGAFIMRYVIADCETPSLNPKDGVCEVAFIEIDIDGALVESHTSLIDPEVPISPEAAGVHGIRDSDVEDAPTLEEYMTIVRDRPYLKDDFIFIAHNAKFDWDRLGSWFNCNTKLCTLRLCRKLWPEAPNHKLQTMRMYLDLPFVRGDAHSALGDVEVCRGIIVKAMSEFNLTMAELVELSNSPIPVKAMSFGKYKGVPLSEVPKQYVTWALKNLDLDPDLKAALEAL